MDRFIACPYLGRLRTVPYNYIQNECFQYAELNINPIDLKGLSKK